MLSEREASPPVVRATQTDHRVLPVHQGDVDGFHPDVLAHAAAEGDVTPYRLRWLQRQYDRGLARRIKAEDSSPVLTRIVGRSGSVDVNAGFERDRRRMKQGAR